MRQIGDQWRVLENADEEAERHYDLGLDRPLEADEKTRANNYYAYRFKLTFNNFCTEKFFSNSSEEFIRNFNKCNEKFHQIESLFGKVQGEYLKDVELYRKSGLNNLKY